MTTPDGAARGRRARLTRSKDFDAVYRRGDSSADRHLVVYLFPREEAVGDGPRLGLSVSRRVGGAVERNHLKRVLREQFARYAQIVPPQMDVVVIARRGVGEYVREQGSVALGDRLGELLRRALGDRACTGAAA